MKKINYSTYYAKNDDINGYVMAEDKGDYYVITKEAYKRACKKLTIGNTEPNFRSEKPVYVKGIDF